MENTKRKPEQKRNVHSIQKNIRHKVSESISIMKFSEKKEPN